MIKKLIIRFLSKIGCLLLKLRGVRTGTGVILSGLPRIKKFPGACITIGNGVTIHSMARMNPVLSHHACLAALSNEARITVEDGCGISGATLVCVNGIHIGRHTLIGADTLILDNDMHYPRSGARPPSVLLPPACSVAFPSRAFTASTCVTSSSTPVCWSAAAWAAS